MHKVMQELKNSFASLTAAQSAVRLLGQNGIHAVIHRVGDANGCRYVLAVEDRYLYQAAAIVGGNGLSGRER